MSEIKRPFCKCHNKEMSWSKDLRISKGGYWKCRVRHSESNRRYEKTPRGQQTTRARKDRYDRSELGQLRRRVDRIRSLDRSEAKLQEQWDALEAEKETLLRRIANGS